MDNQDVNGVRYNIKACLELDGTVSVLAIDAEPAHIPATASLTAQGQELEAEKE